MGNSKEELAEKLRTARQLLQWRGCRAVAEPVISKQTEVVKVHIIVSVQVGPVAVIAIRIHPPQGKQGEVRHVYTAAMV